MFINFTCIYIIPNKYAHYLLHDTPLSSMWFPFFYHWHETLRIRSNITTILIPTQIPTKYMFPTFSKKDIIMLAIIVTVLFGGIGIIVIAMNHKSPEELRQEAIEARIKAMKADCGVIAERVSKCFTSDDKSNCKTMQESYAWFNTQYGESPDFACSTQPDPLTFGAVNK